MLPSLLSAPDSRSVLAPAGAGRWRAADPPGAASPEEQPEEALETPRVELVVGLGNPGVRYQGTRHNIGFEAVEALLRDRSGQRRHCDGGVFVQAEISGREVGLLCPMGYMNRSGGPVRRLVASEGLAPRNVLVVCDDYALPLGAIRTRRRGSDGGHNGLASVIAALGTNEVPRMRLGIGGPPAGEDPADYVLAPFASGERTPVEELLARAVEAIETAVGQGLETAMNRFNRTPA